MKLSKVNAVENVYNNSVFMILVDHPIPFRQLRYEYKMINTKQYVSTLFELLFCISFSFYVFNQPGQTWVSETEQCVTYNCTKVNNNFVLVKTNPSCPVYNPEDCIPVRLLAVAEHVFTSFLIVQSKCAV